MPARHSHDPMNGDDTLGNALRQLPAHAPEGDRWPLLAARIRQRQRARHRHRLLLPAALAAVLALAALVTTLPSPSPPPTASNQATITSHAPAAASPLAPWQQRSHQWQALVHQLDSSGTPLDAEAMAEGMALQDHIGLLDMQLDSAHTSAARLALWQQRVALLQELALLHLRAGQLRHLATTTHAPMRI